MRNKQAIGYLTDEHVWARRHLQDIETEERSREVRRAQAENPDASVTYEIRSEDGRRGTVQAVHLATARKITQSGWTVTWRIYPHYTAPIDPSAPNMLDSLLRAHPETLLDWLERNGFERKGDKI